MTYCGYEIEGATGNVTPAWFDNVGIPDESRGSDKPGVVLLHGASSGSVGTGYDWFLTGWPMLCRVAGILAGMRIPFVAAGMGGNHYANDATTGPDPDDYINKAITHMAAKTGCAADRAHILGLSMGGGTGVRYAGLNPDKVVSLTGLIPMDSLHRIYTQYAGTPAATGFASGIAAATGWNLGFRSAADVVLHSSLNVESATLNFQPGDVGKTIVPNAAGIFQADTKIASRIDSTHITIDKAALVTGTAQTMGIAGALPMSGASGADLQGYFAPIIADAGIPTRFYRSTSPADPYVLDTSVDALAAACGGESISTGASGHGNAAAVSMAAGGTGSNAKGGSNFSEWIEWILSNE